MPYATKMNRAAQDAQRYERKKTQQNAPQKKVFFPLRLDESILAVATRMAAEGMLVGKHPWKTTPDVIRAMIVKGLKAYRDEDHDDNVSVAAALEKLENDLQLADLARDRRTAVATLAKARTEIGAMLEVKSPVSALQTYSTLYENVEKMSKTMWIVWLLDELAKTFPAQHALHEAGHVPGVKMQHTRSREDRRRDADRRAKRKR